METTVKQIFIAWGKPDYHQFYEITGYEVQYKEFGKEWNNIPVLGEDVLDYVINDLKQDTKYQVAMVAVNEHGKGPKTDKPLELQTKAEGLLEHIWNTYKWLIVCGAVALVILFLTWYCLCCRRRRRRKPSRSVSRKRRLSAIPCVTTLRTARKEANSTCARNEKNILGLP